MLDLTANGWGTLHYLPLQTLQPPNMLYIYLFYPGSCIPHNIIQCCERRRTRTTPAREGGGEARKGPRPRCIFRLLYLPLSDSIEHATRQSWRIGGPLVIFMLCRIGRREVARGWTCTVCIARERQARDNNNIEKERKTNKMKERQTDVITN